MSMLRSFPGILVVLFCLAALPGNARQSYNFFSVSLEQGLSDVRAQTIVQDRYGYLWFGTANGLNRYDGNRMTVYLKGRKGLSSSVILALYRRGNGELWVGTAAGALRYNPVRDSFEAPFPFDKQKLKDTTIRVQVFAENHSGDFYAGCRQGVFRLSGDRFVNYGLQQGIDSIAYVSGLRFRPDHYLWITTLNHGFYRADVRSNKILPIPYKTEFGESTVYAMHEVELMPNGQLMVGMHSYGLALLDTGTLRFHTVPGFLGKSDSVRYNAINNIFRDSRGRVWIGTARFGLVQYLPATGELISYESEPFNKFSFGGYPINCIYEDREHNIWIATSRNGIFRFNPGYNGIRYFPWNPLNTTTSLPGREVWSCYTADTALALIGTDNGVAYYNLNDGTMKAMKGIAGYESNSVGVDIQCSFRDSKGIEWYAPRALGLVRYDPVRRSFINFHRDDGRKNHLLEDFISRIEALDSENLLLLNFQRINIFNTKTYDCRYYANDTVNKLFTLENVRDFCKTKDSQLLVAVSTPRESAVYRYSFRSNALELFCRLAPGDSVNIHAISLMPEGSLCCATSQGIFIADTHGRLRQYRNNEDQLSKNLVLGIVTGIPGCIWFCTDREIGRLDMASGKTSWVSKNAGITGSRFFGAAFRLLPGGRIFAGTTNGFFLVDAQQVNRPRSFPVFLTRFSVFGKPLQLSQALPDIRTIHLDHDQNFFSFELSTFNFLHAGATEYSYKLEGFDTDWQPAGESRTGIYTNVPGGVYTLLLRSRLESGDWIVSPQQIRVVVDKPFWEQWWFRGLVVLGAAAIAYAFYRYRVHNINKEARLRADYEIRANELEISALRTQMNPHFIFNCLNTINSYVNSNKKEQANRYITSFAKLIRMILDNSRQKRICLSEELEALQLYADMERLRFTDSFSFRIHIADDVDTGNVEVPPLIIQPFVENSILHGLLPAAHAGELTVRITREGEMLCYEISDNGIGRKAAAARRGHGDQKKTSHGMDITLKRIELFNQEHDQKLPLSVTDLTDAEGRPAGTSVRICLAYSERF